ncbi:hypothetical protein [Campylobacter sp. MIT 97-5078]|uniref:hypothetical protein n=1 Tax=Campylobacter sp. MIT 97-5078 TaxID=1548153 RepID=UPI000513AA47|nr:hypothetical protein [Campylobacter sp. MIT 97-5078]KGI55450.1 hypothetical protein LR59_12045 [Campylobacter sp. MIT 97-5078]KGI57359.1 hypothetical protein LR59_01115 [Campylobacter sp. MIT 97-5078]TQR27447.1 hypothetical protein DMB91_04105 [Campylobacter sp. MIT 97-5078]
MKLEDFSKLEVPSMYKVLDAMLKPLEVHCFSSRDKSIAEFELDELKEGYESIKFCLIDEDGHIQRDTISQAYVLNGVNSHKQALIAYFKTLFL